MNDDDISIALDAFFMAFKKFIDAILEADRRELPADEDLDLAADQMVQAAIEAGDAGVEWLSSDTAEVRELLSQRKEKRRRKRLAQAS